MQLVCQSLLSSTAAQAVHDLHGSGATAVDITFGVAQHLNIDDPAQVGRVREALDVTGMRPYSAHCSFGPHADLSATDAAAHEAAIAGHVREIEVARQLGIEVVIVHPGVDTKPETRNAQLAAAADGMARIMPAAEANGVQVAFENLPPSYIGDSIEELVRLVDGVNSSYAGFCLDTGHCNLCRIPIGGMVEGFGERIRAIHWHDNDGTGDRHRIPGSGTTDWPSFFGALARIGYDGPVMLEADPRPMPLAEVARLGQLALDERRAMYV